MPLRHVSCPLLRSLLKATGRMSGKTIVLLGCGSHCIHHPSGTNEEETEVMGCNSNEGIPMRLGSRRREVDIFETHPEKCLYREYYTPNHADHPKQVRAAGRGKVN
jgi:hypothetical protein